MQQEVQTQEVAGTTTRAANPVSTARIAMHPIHPMLVPFPIVCFTGALVTDIAYWSTAEMMWADFSAWLLFAGLIIGGLAAIAGLIDFLGDRRIRRLAYSWYHMAGNVVVMLLALFNALVHSRDAWTSVVPAGLVLSALTVLVMLFTGWLGGAMVHRYRIGVID
ncbi:putative membrane protein [Bradyrhizobium sp. USDA 4473]